MKIVKQLIIIIIPVILVVIVGGLCYLFIPRSLTNIVPTDNIICIYYEYDSTDTAEQIFLTEQEQQELKDILSKKKYRPQNIAEKAVSSRRICILYKDGMSIQMDSCRITKIKDASSKKYSIHLIGEGNLFKFFPEQDDLTLK